MTSHYSDLLFTKRLKNSDSFSLQQTFYIDMIDITDAEGRHVRLETSASAVGMRLLITLQTFKQTQQSFWLCLQRS